VVFRTGFTWVETVAETGRVWGGTGSWDETVGGYLLVLRGVVEEACDRAGALPGGSRRGGVNAADAPGRLLDSGGPRQEGVPRRCGPRRACQ